MRLFMFTSIALFAFAANSLLCRMAFVENSIEPLPFTLIRIISGALLLALLVRPNLIKGISEIKRMVDIPNNKTSWLSAISLSVYAFAFSWAYVGMDTGMGALILFATIQIVLNIVAQVLGAKTNAMTLLGIVIAFMGLVVLLLPGQSAPNFERAAVMMLAGLGWAGFVFAGRNSLQPLNDVAVAFRWSLVWCLPLVFFVDWQGSTAKGIILAVLSGTLASGLGYALWYKVLPQLGLQNAAQAQLVVPVLALIMGVLFLSEQLTLTLLLACLLILIGITLAIRSKKV
jgi:drug/metabolite transporter (DMT)-like permease